MASPNDMPSAVDKEQVSFYFFIRVFPPFLQIHCSDLGFYYLD